MITQHLIKKQSGLSLVELMVALAISLVIVAAAIYAYLASREGQRSVERLSASRETGAFVLQTIGRELMNAGYYPANVLPIPADVTQRGMYDSYYPLQGGTRINTDWENIADNWPPVAYQTGVYGCDGGQFDSNNGTCPSADSTKPDTLIVNYFTGDARDAPGTSKDCTGAFVSNDPSNAVRKLNKGGSEGVPHTAMDNTLPPQLPLFVSNRYTLSDVKMFVDNNDLNTKSMSCSGNGQSYKGVIAIYQPLVAGVEDLQFTYGVYTAYDPTATYNSLAPTRFYTATEVNTLAALNVRGHTLTAWQRVTAVRVCLLTRTLGGSTRITDASDSASKYKDCSGTEKNQPAGYQMARYEQVFGVRNALRLSY